jgi:hypothetical protein
MTTLIERAQPTVNGYMSIGTTQLGIKRILPICDVISDVLLVIGVLIRFGLSIRIEQDF